MEFKLPQIPARPSVRTSGAKRRTVDAGASPSEFLVFANVGEAIAATPAKLEKIRLLADYLRGLTREQLPNATRYFTGKAFAQSDPRTLQVGWSVIFRAMQAATKVSDAEFHRIASTHGDAGKTAFEVLDGRTTPQPFSISESGELFENLHRARGPIAKAELLRNRFSKLSAREGQYVVKILTGDLRIGLREGLVEEAIAKAFGVSLEQVREANMLLGDIGQTALLASRNELARAELSPFRPIKCMLATPEPTAEAVWERFAEAARTGRERASSAPTTVYLEDKFDGIRAQLHRSAQQVEIFSRDLRRITGQFPELADEARNFQEELIIDDALSWLPVLLDAIRRRPDDEDVGTAVRQALASGQVKQPVHVEVRLVHAIRCRCSHRLDDGRQLGAVELMRQFQCALESIGSELRWLDDLDSRFDELARVERLQGA